MRPDGCLLPVIAAVRTCRPMDLWPLSIFGTPTRGAVIKKAWPREFPTIIIIIYNGNLMPGFTVALTMNGKSRHLTCCHKHDSPAEFIADLLPSSLHRDIRFPIFPTKKKTILPKCHSTQPKDHQYFPLSAPIQSASNCA